MTRLPILYVSPESSVCREALAYFAQHGVALQIRDVLTHSENMKRLVEVSGQFNTPTLEFGEYVIPDFTIGELIEELDAAPELKKALGFGADEE